MLLMTRFMLYEDYALVFYPAHHKFLIKRFLVKNKHVRKYKKVLHEHKL